MRVIFAGVIILVTLLMACGDGDDNEGTAPATTQDILHLRGYDISPENFRFAIRGFFLGQDSNFCNAIRGLSPSQAIDLLDQSLQGLPSGIPLPNATPVSAQEQRNRQDEERAAQIALDECAEG